MSKDKICDGCGHPKKIWKNIVIDGERKRYCQPCWKLELPKHSEKHKPTVKQTSLRSRSNKRSKEEKIYSARRIIFLLQRPMCEAHLQGCKQRSSEVHHKKGRDGSLFLDEKFWLSTCRSCHQWVTDHPEEAIQLGLSISRSQ